MSKTNREKRIEEFDGEVKRWDAAMKKGRLDQALGHAAKALQIAVTKKERALQKAAIIYVETTLARAIPDASGADTSAKLVCSFCGRNRDEARLLVGADGQICEFCCKKAAGHFESEESNTSSL
jgi:hypothetical protein